MNLDLGGALRAGLLVELLRLALLGAGDDFDLANPATDEFCGQFLEQAAAHPSSLHVPCDAEIDDLFAGKILPGSPGRIQKRFQHPTYSPKRQQLPPQGPYGAPAGPLDEVTVDLTHAG